MQDYLKQIYHNLRNRRRQILRTEPHRYGGGERTYFLISGVVISVPVSIFFEFTSHFWFTFIGIATIVAPFVEEFAKANSLFYRQERPVRALMVLGFLSGLGFGIAEAVVYVSLGVPFIVRVPAIFFHASGTAVIGYGVGTKRTPQFYLLAVFLHFLNNALATTGISISAFAATGLAYVIAWWLFAKARTPAVPTS